MTDVIENKTKIFLKRYNFYKRVDYETNLKYQGVNKEAVINRQVVMGELDAIIVADTGISRSTIYDWIKIIIPKKIPI